MVNDKNLQPVIENINKIKWGYLKIEKDSIIASSNKLIQIMNSDEKGNLYFFATVSPETNGPFNKRYYASLSFNDKTSPQKISLSGYVCAASTPNNFPNNKLISAQEFLLFKFKIMQVEITEFNTSENNTQPYSFSNFLTSFWKNI